MARRTVILQVEESKADGLVDALSKRDYISVVRMDREGRKHLRDCPACNKRLSQEVSYTINEKMLEAMLGVIRKMSVSKGVILINKENPLNLIPDVEHRRCVEFDHKLAARAEALGLLTPFMDGDRQTYFTEALDFFLCADSHEPSPLVTLDGEIVDKGGVIAFEEVKLKDEKRRDQLKRLFREAVGAIPESTITFVENGQMSLV